MTKKYGRNFLHQNYNTTIYQCNDSYFAADLIIFLHVNRELLLNYNTCAYICLGMLVRLHCAYKSSTEKCGCSLMSFEMLLIWLDSRVR